MGLTVTTIAYDGKTLAADGRRISEQTIKSDNTPKLRRVEVVNGPVAWVATSGEYQDGIVFAEWIMLGDFAEAKPDMSDEFEALVVIGDACFRYEHKLVPMLITDPFTAVGSGLQFAFGAMAMGASARKAVEIAARFDPMTGGTILESEPER